jgi:hypothetical protein
VWPYRAPLYPSGSLQRQRAVNLPVFNERDAAVMTKIETNDVNILHRAS